MKEIKTIKMVEQIDVKFVAFDGKEFTGDDAEFLCEEYERQHDAQKVKEKFERLDVHKIKIDPVKWYRYEAEFWIVSLESKNDYYTLYDYLKICERCCDINLDKPEEYPCKITIASDGEYVSNYNGNLRKQLEEALDKVKATGAFHKYPYDGVK